MIPPHLDCLVSVVSHFVRQCTSSLLIRTSHNINALDVHCDHDLFKLQDIWSGEVYHKRKERNKHYSAQLLIDSYPDSLYSDKDPSESTSETWTSLPIPSGIIRGRPDRLADYNKGVAGSWNQQQSTLSSMYEVRDHCKQSSGQEGVVGSGWGDEGQYLRWSSLPTTYSRGCWGVGKSLRWETRESFWYLRLANSRIKLAGHV